ncbi:MAG: 50S ribosomal protein L29 [Symbiobacteriaceae bacterium]|nr:50S ribosomal protein L29 [Symbiobacteriaceae bacterium]
MKGEELKQLWSMDITELEKKLADYKEELFHLRFQMAAGQLENPMRIRETRKNIARVQTRIRQRQLNIGS